MTPEQINPNCEHCHGTGYIVVRGYHYSYYAGTRVDCDACLLLSGDKGAIRRRLNEIMDSTEDKLRQFTKQTGESLARNRRLSPAAAQFVEDYAVYSSEAQEYRRLLVQLWS